MTQRQMAKYKGKNEVNRLVFHLHFHFLQLPGTFPGVFLVDLHFLFKDPNLLLLFFYCCSKLLKLFWRFRWRWHWRWSWTQVIVNRCWLRSWFVRFPLFPRWITHFQILIKYKIKVIRFSCANFFSGNKGNRRYIREFLPPTGANDLSSALTEGFKEMYWRDCLCSAGWSPCQCSMNYGDDPMNASCYSLFCLLDPC